MSPGYTVEEIEALVEEYMALRQGQKGPWLKARSISKYQLHRWRQAYLAGDLARGLVPRDSVTRPDAIRRAIEAEKQLEAQQRAHADELKRLHRQIETLQGGNAALGKAIGLLRELDSQEPGTTPDDPTCEK
ncbi:hypothetical protein O4157_21145 [Gordonia amicalis]|uniref:hypothetical protein n=1 Tax=Gordonia amicalis TaxID=89053 RepID=UPI0022B52441|nr:hypothetical protein [Gordonia amicalis]MCZ4653912.1 hypothetical protein [Gordonia amicalis]